MERKIVKEKRDNLTDILSRTAEELKSVDVKLKSLEEFKRRKKELEEIRDIINGLSVTKHAMKRPKDPNQRDYDSGKYDTAYFYLSSMNLQNLAYNKNFQPSVWVTCPKCKSQAPVLMSYTQTYDSPEGDEWCAELFTICCGAKNLIKKIERDNRFL